MTGDGVTTVAVTFDDELGAWLLDGSDAGPASSAVAELGELDWHVDWCVPGRVVLAVVPTTDGTRDSPLPAATRALVARLCGEQVLEAFTDPADDPEPRIVALDPTRSPGRQAAGMLAVSAEYAVTATGPTWWSVAAVVAAADAGASISEISRSDDIVLAEAALATLTDDEYVLMELRLPELASMVLRAARLVAQVTGRAAPDFLAASDPEIDHRAEELLSQLATLELAGALLRSVPGPTAPADAVGSVETALAFVGVDAVRSVEASADDTTVTVRARLGSRPAAALVAVLVDAASGAELETQELRPDPDAPGTVSTSFDAPIDDPAAVAVMVTEDADARAGRTGHRRTTTAHHHARSASHVHRVALALAESGRLDAARRLAAEARRLWETTAGLWERAGDDAQRAAAADNALGCGRIARTAGGDSGTEIERLWVLDLWAAGDVLSLAVEDALDLPLAESATVLSDLLLRCEALERWDDVVQLQDHLAAAFEATATLAAASAMNELAADYAWRCAEPSLVARAEQRRLRLRARRDVR